MSLNDIVDFAINKENFISVESYLKFSAMYLEFVDSGVQAEILSQNEQHYKFIQYKDDGHRNITRPINSNLMLKSEDLESSFANFMMTLEALENRERPDDENREAVVRSIYTVQQSIGAALDALPAGASNQARKINGDLFERLIKMLISYVGVDCTSGVVKVPVKDDDGVELFRSCYQHDLLINNGDELKIIGSVKTSSKDRIDKIFLDKFLYNRLTGTEVPHVAIFLNDVQRAKRKNKATGAPAYGVSSTFLPGHFKAFTIKLNPLDGVYYCDIRPSMRLDPITKDHIKTIDEFFYSDLWELLNRQGQALEEVEIEEGEFSDEEN